MTTSERVVSCDGDSVIHFLTNSHLYFRMNSDGPCIIMNNGTCCWYGLDDQLHRIDGPAISGVEGLEKKYFIDGREMSRERFVAWYEVVFLKEYVQPDDSKWFHEEYEFIGQRLQ